MYYHIGSSHVRDNNNDIDFGMCDHLWDTHAIEGMWLIEFQQGELEDNVHITHTFFKSMKSTSTPSFLGMDQSLLNYGQKCTIQLEINVWYAKHTFLRQLTIKFLIFKGYCHTINNKRDLRVVNGSLHIHCTFIACYSKIRYFYVIMSLETMKNKSNC